MLAAGSANAPFTTIGGNDNTYPQGRKVTQWQINDNLIWTRNEHTFKFGINTRRVDVSDYDLGQGTVPTVLYNDLAEFTYGAAYTASQTFPISLKERVANGNLDLYAMDTYKPSPRLTLTAGVRATWNTNPVNQQAPLRPSRRLLPRHEPQRRPAARPGHPDQRSATLYPGHAAAGLAAARLARLSASPAGPRSTPASASSTTSFPRRSADLAATNAPYAPTFVGGIGGQVGGVGHRARRPRQRGRRDRHRQQRLPIALQQRTPRPAPASLPAPPPAHSRSASIPSPPAPSRRPTTTSTTSASSNRSARTALFASTTSARAACTSPFRSRSTATRTSAPAASRPTPTPSPLDQRFGSVNEFRTDANSNYSGLQTSFTEQIHGLTLRANYTLSHCLDEVSNGGLLPFSTQGILSPLPGELSRQYGNCDYDVRHNLSAYGMYQLPFHSEHRLLRQLFGGWSFSETAFLHSGLPFTVLSQPYTAERPGHLPGQRPAVRPPRSRRPRLQQEPLPRRHRSPAPSSGSIPAAFVSVVDPTTGACTGGDSVANCQFGDCGRNTVRGPHFTDSDIYITKQFPIARRHHPALRHPDVQRLQPPQLRPAQRGRGRRARQLHPGPIRHPGKHHLATHRSARRRPRRRQLAAHDCFPGKDRILIAQCSKTALAICLRVSSGTQNRQAGIVAPFNEQIQQTRMVLQTDATGQWFDLAASRPHERPFSGRIRTPGLNWSFISI